MPRLLKLKEKVDRGEKLDDLELEFLAMAMKDVKDVLPIVTKYPAYSGLTNQVLDLYKHISDKALSIEKGS